MSPIRWLIVFLPLIGSGFGFRAAPVDVVSAPNNVVKVRDYAVGNGTTDDTAAVQAAIDQWLSNQQVDTGGVLDFGSGHYLVHPLYMIRPGNAPIYGEVRGDGPELAVINSFPGEHALTIQNYIKGTFGGLKFSGGPAGDSDPNHVGLTIGNASPGLGTEGVDFHNLSFEHYGVGLSVGDPRTSGSAAENAFRNIGASQNHIGVLLVTFNTLDNVFTQLNLAENDYGVYSTDAYGNQFLNGAGSNNNTTFYLSTPGQETIVGWREEYGSRTQYWVQYGGAAAPTLLTVIGSNTVDTLNPHRALPESIHAITAASQALILSSMLDGGVSGKKVTIVSSSFTNGNAIVRPQWIGEINSCIADINNGQCSADIPNQISGIGGGGNPQPTATPTPAVLSTPTAPPLATRTATPVPAVEVTWSVPGTLSNPSHGGNGVIPLTFTTTGSDLFYEWLSGTGAVVAYGDHAAVAQTETAFPVGVVNPNKAGSYTLRFIMIGAPNPLDIGSIVVT